ncbi:type IV secretory system conjugative DNA transfer family protein, partial [Streptomyces sp. WAC 06725]|uniref:type IV secretory system conjugative DNA transfer family protein n=1 Tax=Streptomyces sp. WAC 06725 TaxID=2203209 RepID=UPI0021AD64D2
TGGPGGGRGRGVPDSLLIGVLVFLLGLTVLAWTATGLAGLFTHGAWPDGVTFTRTPLALRSLIAAPHDLPAAWPGTPAAQLSGYGLFWGILISELLVLVVLTVFALGTIARYRVVRANRRAEGPLVVATTDPALWADTKDARAKLGPLLTYDPQHLLDTPARLRWSPTSGCEDIAVAAERAAALLTPVRPSSVLDSAVADSATTLLRCWLHAAAVDGRPFRQLHRWAHTSGAAHEPVRVLRTNRKASAGQAGELESVLTAHAERREMAQELVSRTLACLSSIHIRDACNPARSDALLLESFIDEGGTLYVAGESIEDPRTAPGAMPLLIALLSHVVERGRRMAERSSAGRLDPPLTLVLHDIAALAPFPALPGLLETGREQGLLTLVTLRSQEQARARWPHHALPD